MPFDLRITSEIVHIVMIYLMLRHLRPNRGGTG